MTKARDLANLIAAGSGLADGTVQVADITDLTATAAELNILDGATVSTAELNYVSGVTSAVQTQLDGKMTPTYTGNVSVTGVFEVQGGITEESVDITSSGGAATIDLSTSTNFVHDLTENVTYTFSNAASSGKTSSFTLKVVQDATARTITWPASVDWAAATAPTLTADANGVDVFVFMTHDGGTTWYGFTAGQAMG